MVGEGWKLAGIGEVEDRRGSLGPAGERAPPVLESALTFCHENTQTGRDVKSSPCFSSSSIIMNTLHKY